VLVPAGCDLGGVARKPEGGDPTDGEAVGSSTEVGSFSKSTSNPLAVESQVDQPAMPNGDATARDLHSVESRTTEGEFPCAIIGIGVNCCHPAHAIGAVK